MKMKGYDSWRTAGPLEYFECEDCPCEEPDAPEGIRASGEICTHPDVCGCDQCECSCHNADDGSAAYEDMRDRESWERSDPDWGHE